MTLLKQIIAYVFLSIYVIAFAIGAFGAIGLLKIDMGAIISLFTLVAVQTVALFTAIVKAQHYFEDPPAVTKLKQVHAQEISALNQVISDAAAQHAATETAQAQEIRKLKSDNARMLAQLTPNRKLAQIIMPGSEHTREGQQGRPA